MKLHDKPLAFIGPMGSGKSSLARKASAAYGGGIFDTDREFTQRYGEISIFFAERGEAEFRRIECELLKEAAASGAAYISTGGGAVLSKPAMNALRASCDIVYLTAPTDILKQRIARSDRPLKNDLEQVIERRAPLYERYADYTIDTSVDSLKALTAALKQQRRNRYDAVLCDSDNTLLDFDAARSQSIRAVMAGLGLDIDGERADRTYAGIVCEVWHRLERGELTRDGLDTERARLLGERLNVSIDAQKFNALYVEEMRKTRFVLPGATEFLDALRARGIAVYVITNSFTRIAEERLKPLEAHVDGCFISEKIGFYKPDRAYFDRVLEATGIDGARTVVFGDSETSDIAGGINSGLDTCLLDRSGGKPTAADYSVRGYNGFLDIV